MRRGGRAHVQTKQPRRPTRSEARGKLCTVPPTCSAIESGQLLAV